MTGEIPEEWKNSIVIPIYKKGNKRWKTIGILAYLMRVIKYIVKVLNKKLKAHAEQFLLECQNGFRKGRSCVDPLFSMKLLIEKEESLI
jgi:hypothetical protein